MLIGELGNSGAIPTLEAMVRFAGARQRVLANNIANIATPDFRTADVDPRAFQAQLGRAVEERRKAGETSPLKLRDTQEVRVRQDGTGGHGLELRPRTASGNILFHDRNDRDVEKLMADQAENVGVFRTSIELLRSRYDVLKVAISERV
jgi:flagellar basal-body rod protein FlgB